MTKRKISIRKVAARLTEMVIDGMKDLPREEQEQRLQAFCADAEKLIQKKPA